MVGTDSTRPIRPAPLMAAGLLAAGDAACLAGAYGLSLWITGACTTGLVAGLVQHVLLLVAGSLVWYVTAFCHQVFPVSGPARRLPQMYRIVRVLVIWAGLTIFVLALSAPDATPRPSLLVFLLIHGLLVLGCRWLIDARMLRLNPKDHSARRLVIIGANAATAHLVRTMQANSEYDCDILGFLDDEPQRAPILERQGLAYLGPISTLELLLVEGVVDAVYVSLPLKSFYETLKSIVYLCEGVGVPVRMIADLFPLRVASSTLSRSGRIPLISIWARPEILLYRHCRLLANRILLAYLSRKRRPTAAAALHVQGTISAKSPASYPDKSNKRESR